LKVSPLGDVEGLGLGAAGLGEGDAAAVGGDEPHAAAIAAIVTSAINLFNPESPIQDCSRRYPCRLLDVQLASALEPNGARLGS
jgi:hypothetical protein